MYKLELPHEMIADLYASLSEEAFVTKDGKQRLREKKIARIGNLKVEIYSNEHPPPHFHVSFNNESNSYTIKDCKPLNGNGLSRYYSKIKNWHSENKMDIIKHWNTNRPSNCPEGLYKE